MRFRFSSSDTIPLARGSWAAPTIQLVDGHFSPDGSAFAVADVAGQFSLYGAGPAADLLRAAPYDQFFKKDYDPIMQVAVTDSSGVLVFWVEKVSRLRVVA